MSKLVIIDFKDSFTYNIYHYFDGMGVEVDILEDEKFDINDLMPYDHIVLSPGPGLPSEKQSLFRVLEKYCETKRILGICLGMQGIVEYFGGSIYNQKQVRHGEAVLMKITDHTSLFKGVQSEIKVGLYHSWACDLSSTNKLKSLAESNDGVVMAVQHKDLPIFGVQYHPESILSENGKDVLFNFINFKH